MSKHKRAKKAAAKRAKRATTHSTPTQLAVLLARRTRAHPERLATLAAQLAHVAEVRLELRDARRRIRQLRAAAASAAAPVDAPASTPASAAVIPSLNPDLEQALAHESQRRAREHVAVSLALAEFPIEWADSFAATATNPHDVARALLLAMRRVQ